MYFRRDIRIDESVEKENHKYRINTICQGLKKHLAPHILEKSA